MTTQIKEYSEIEAALATLAQRYSKVPDTSTDKGLVACKKDYREIRAYEIKLDKKRLELGAEARKHLALVNSEASEIDARLKAISTPFKEAADAREAELKEAEAKRIADIRSSIDGLRAFVADARDADSEGVSGIIEAVDMIDCSENFEEFTQEALKTKQEVLDNLSDQLSRKLAEEAAERDRKRLEAERAEKERARVMDQRLNTLRMIPMGLMGQNALSIRSKIDSLNTHIPTADDFADRHGEALQAHAQVLQQLEQMAAQAEQMETLQEQERIRQEETARQAQAQAEAEALNAQQVKAYQQHTADQEPVAQEAAQTVEDKAPMFKMPTPRVSPQRRISDYLMDTVSLDEPIANLVAELILTNQIPCVEIRASQSAA